MPHNEDLRTVTLCPHCKLWHDGKISTHCPDRDPWTQAERDARRDQLRERYPSVVFTRSSCTEFIDRAREAKP